MSDEFWGGGVSHLRGKDKVERVIRWLAWFNYANRKTLAGMLGVEERGQNSFFKRLEESGFVVTERAPGLKQVIYGLGDAGFDLANLLLPELELSRRRRLPAWITLVHTFSIQNALIYRLDDISDFAPEKALKHLIGVRLPDAVVTYKDGRKCALEIELNHKATPRVYHMFLSHLKNINRQHYQSVEYLFQSEALARLYRDKFEQPVWPIYVPHPVTGKLQLQNDKQFLAREKGVIDSGLIRFKVEELYTL